MSDVRWNMRSKSDNVVAVVEVEVVVVEEVDCGSVVVVVMAGPHIPYSAFRQNSPSAHIRGPHGTPSGRVKVVVDVGCEVVVVVVTSDAPMHPQSRAKTTRR